MADGRAPIKLDFTSGLDKLPAKPKLDAAATTQASVDAGRELGFVGRMEASVPLPVPAPAPVPEAASAFRQRLDGRSLRSRGANVQMNIKVTAEEKDLILREAARLIQDGDSKVTSIGEFVVRAVHAYQRVRAEGKDGPVV